MSPFGLYQPLYVYVSHDALSGSVFNCKVSFSLNVNNPFILYSVSSIQ